MARVEKILRAEHVWHFGSSVIETEPVGFQAQQNFLNSVAYVSSRLDFAEFRAYLKDVEKRLGRKKEKLKSGPRTMDLDIIFHNGRLMDEDALTYDYVRRPMAEIQVRLAAADPDATSATAADIVRAAAAADDREVAIADDVLGKPGQLGEADDASAGVAKNNL